jgi:hypothetical protein
MTTTLSHMALQLQVEGCLVKYIVYVFLREDEKFKNATFTQDIIVTHMTQCENISMNFTGDRTQTTQ